MSSLLTLAKDLEQQSKAQQQSTGEMLKAAFSEHEQSVRAELSASARRISDAILAHEQSMSEAMEKNRRSVLRTAGRTWLTILMVSALLIGTSGSILWWQGQQITDNYTHLRQQEDTLAKMTARTWGVRYQESSDGRRFLILPPGMQTEAIPMTELEKQLLSALEQLQQDYSQRLDEWESAFAEWRSMCGLMQRENAVLNERVSNLSTQVLSLSEQLRRLSGN
ncbi:MbeB family protein [Enterobacter hormaechei]|nr:MbeB family protein [Enterobacter hormaechei]